MPKSEQLPPIYAKLGYVGADVDGNIHLYLTKENKFPIDNIVKEIRTLQGKDIGLILFPLIRGRKKRVISKVSVNVQTSKQERK